MSAPTETTFPAALAALARRFPDQEAVVAPEGRMTFAEFTRRCEELASAFAAAGLRPGDRVGILLPNGLRWLVTMIGAQRAGLVAVPINTWYRSAELAHLLGTAQLRLVVTEEKVFGKDMLAELAAAGYDEVFATGARTDGYLGALLWPAAEQLPPGIENGPAPAQGAGPEDIAMILYTSGSTALPKAVPLEHGKLLRNGHAMGTRMRVGPGDRLWFAMPLFFGYGACNALPVALSHGITLCIEEKVEGDASLAFIERERCTVSYGLATAVRALLAAPSFGTRDISSLRTGPVGFNSEDKRLAIEGLGITEACSAFGLTESYGFVTMTDAHDPLEVKLHTQGTCLPTQHIRIVDKTGAVCAPGASGEIEVRGCVIDGYLGHVEPGDTHSADGWFRTGDLGSIDADGRLAFGGRWKEMLKIKGINVSPLEIEGILGEHAEVDQAYVIGLSTSDGDQEMACVVVPDERRVADEAGLAHRLREYIRDRAASYKVPARVVVMGSHSVPQTHTGKVSKLKLREMLEAAE
ncbi:class I adenylate-forming enzyme family protein [Amycolatopsis sp. NPDC049868]|uniref:class I adenylate-forming enzyme family protein n=1 Tax=Amycolatopsis sp. NPDC049868 TaxID=3363934 RepID=UPI00378CEA36